MTERSIYGRIPAPIEVIPNGVDLERFRPASAEERAAARAALGVSDDAFVAVFIGHEFDRKGLPIAMAALEHVPTAILVVVGGTADMIRRASAQAAALGVGGRVRFVGADPDPVRYLRASDVFVLPSAYESYGLVVTEALASGVPVVSAPVGVAPDVIVDGENGYLTPANAEEFGRRLAQIATADLEACPFERPPMAPEVTPDDTAVDEAPDDTAVAPSTTAPPSTTTSAPPTTAPPTTAPPTTPPPTTRPPTTTTPPNEGQGQADQPPDG